MDIQFKDKKQIVTHPSGVVTEYTAEQLQAQADATDARILELTAEKNSYLADVNNINNS